MTATTATAEQSGLRARMGEFFYGLEVPYGLALARICLCFTLLLAMGVRWHCARELWSSDGAPTPIWTLFGYPNLLPEPSGMVAVALENVLLLAMFTACIGLCSRVSLTIATFSYIYLNALDSISTMTKYSVIAAHVMVLLCFSQCGSVWSVDNWLRRSRLRRQGFPAVLASQPLRYPATARRLVQLLVGAVYFGAAATKLHTPAFFTGEQLETWMITEYNFPNPFGSIVSMHASLLVAMAYVSVIWEITFVFLSWKGLGRVAMLTLGVIFHVMTWLTLGLYAFPLVCISTYFAFVNERDIERLMSLLTRWRVEGGALRSAFGRLIGVPVGWLPPALGTGFCHAAFGIVAVITIAGGVAVEYQLDRYGERRPEGRYSLKELDSGYVLSIIRPTTRIENDDKVMTFDVGSVMACGCVLDRKSTFHQGETLRAQCGLAVPHEDLWVECCLHDWDDRVVDTVGVYAPVDAMRPLFHYTLGDCLMPGHYSFVLKIAGEEIMRRPIDVLPRAKSCLAN